MPKCPSCSRVNPTESKFCANCGGRLPISPPTREVTPRITEPSSVGIAAYIAISVGGFFLLMGWSAIETADMSEDLASGTIIEDDPFSNQLNENMRNRGYSQCAVGVVICLIGVIIAGIGERPSKSTREDGGGQIERSKELARKRNSGYQGDDVSKKNKWWEEAPSIENTTDVKSGKYALPCPNCDRRLTIPYWHSGEVKCTICGWRFTPKSPGSE